ncbi:ferritin-like domain-domain-containing protein [Catenaria anguillulae PL171]|uniref:Ferritin-like domain-domain-containing protein n=1 Tax=Catenaria anguillulae PL171 TaxID=765915 RepID=A0A1Y2HL37_9FUNG|nr:ferritin-like domain-domain-containing protein [Catenaria anguillulae PL171]
MRLSVHLISLAALVAAAFAAPASTLYKRQNNGNNGNNGQNQGGNNNADLGILNFALTLELLEASFYQEGLRRFPEAEMRRAGVADAGMAVRNLVHLLEHESAHCEFAFNLPDVRTFLSTARVLEKVGVSAYAGALAGIQNPALQTAAGTIATVEARHASFLNALNNIDPAPEAFDTPLNGAQVLTLAAPFIRSCNVDLGIRALTALDVETPTARPGEQVRFRTNLAQLANNQQTSCVFMFNGQSIVAPLNNGQCQVPAEARGDVYLMAVRGNQAPSAQNQNAILAGPTVFSVDTFALDSCREIHGSKNQRIQVNNDVRDYGERRMGEMRDMMRRREENRKAGNGNGGQRAAAPTKQYMAPPQQQQGAKKDGGN